MSKVLCITANPRPKEKSFSLKLAEAFMDEYRQLSKDDRISNLDVYSDDIPLLDRDVLDCWDRLHGGCSIRDLDSQGQQKLKRIDELVDQFIEADKYVFVSPLWNLSIPPMLKAYIDTVCIAGKTFEYTAEGPRGLLQGKNAIHIQARGGIYSEGPMSEFELGDRYLRSILAFMGVTEIQSLVVEGMFQHPERADEYLEEAKGKCRLAAEMLMRGGSVRPGGRSVERPGQHIHG
ncbi:MAG: FMN-dependent NADH-azoreductase [Firmicutes bacterium]|nr:FMN-dependent NADH-azoreductase [Bacillota bacterium]